MILAAMIWQCSALNTGTGMLYYAKNADKRMAQRRAVRICEAYSDPSGDTIGSCFFYKCQQIEQKPACRQVSPSRVECEMDSKDPGAEMFMRAPASQ